MKIIIPKEKEKEFSRINLIKEKLKEKNRVIRNMSIELVLFLIFMSLSLYLFNEKLDNIYRIIIGPVFLSEIIILIFIVISSKKRLDTIARDINWIEKAEFVFYDNKEEA